MQPEAAIPRKLVLHPAWLAFAALALAVPMSVLLLRPAIRSELPVLAGLPPFSLVAAPGRAAPMSGRRLRPASRSERPDLAELPPFSLVDEQGTKFGRNEMLGKVWIADFVFTSCADACPQLQAK